MRTETRAGRGLGKGGNRLIEKPAGNRHADLSSQKLELINGRCDPLGLEFPSRFVCGSHNRPTLSSRQTLISTTSSMLQHIQTANCCPLYYFNFAPSRGHLKTRLPANVQRRQYIRGLLQLLKVPTSRASIFYGYTWSVVKR